MPAYQKYLIHKTESARKALRQLSELAIPNTAIFIVDLQQQLLGSLTDGDIRRGLLADKNIDDPVSTFMHKTSRVFRQGENNYEKIKNYKKLRLQFIPVIDHAGKLVDVIDIQQLQSIIPVDAVIMAGGKGERLKPLTDHIPKPMLKVGTKPIIQYNIDRLAYYGVKNFTISVRYLANQIIQGLSTEANAGVNLKFIKEEHPLGTIGALKLVPSLEHDIVLLMNSDLLTNIDYEDFYQEFIKSGADMQVATIPYHIDVPYAIMDVTDTMDVLSFKEKPRYTHYSNAGIYIFKKELINMIPANQFFDATHFMEKIIESGKKLKSYPILTYWLDIGRMEDYNKAQEDIKHIRF